MTNSSVPLFTFSEKERREQDDRLKTTIDNLWQAGGITWWRDRTPLVYAHERWLNMFKAGNSDVIPDYLNMILAMATTVSGYFIPVDHRPARQRRPGMMREGRVAFQVVVNTIREGAGVFTPGKLQRNAHYSLLAAHLLCWPEEIRDASDILDWCYPWPFVIRLDDEGAAYVQRQVDMDSTLETVANRIERAIHRDDRQAPRAAYNSLHKIGRRMQGKPERKAMKANRQQLAAVVARLIEEDPSRSYRDILYHNDGFKKAQQQFGTYMNVLSNLTKLMQEYSAETGWQRPKRRQPDWTHY